MEKSTTRSKQTDDTESSDRDVEKIKRTRNPTDGPAQPSPWTDGSEDQRHVRNLQMLETEAPNTSIP